MGFSPTVGDHFLVGHAVRRPAAGPGPQQPAELPHAWFGRCLDAMRARPSIAPAGATVLAGLPHPKHGRRPHAPGFLRTVVPSPHSWISTSMHPHETMVNDSIPVRTPFEATKSRLRRR